MTGKEILAAVLVVVVVVALGVGTAIAVYEEAHPPTSSYRLILGNDDFLTVEADAVESSHGCTNFYTREVLTMRVCVPHRVVLIPDAPQTRELPPTIAVN